MEKTTGLRILFVINPISGGKKKFDWESIIRSYFKNLSHTIEFYVLSGKDDTVSLNYWIKKLEINRVIAVGGDGTVMLVAKQLLGTGLAMGILPAGSANGTARELDIPETAEEALDIIANGSVKCCDVIKINGNDFSVHLSDLGLNARLIKYFNEGALRGMWGYSRMVLKVLWHKTLMSAHIKADNLDVKTNAYMLVIANASKYGTGAVINPKGNICDGAFEIVVLRDVSLLQFFRMLLSYKRFNPKKMEVFRAKSATITTRRKTHFQIDGEYKGKIDRVTAEILPSQLNILVKKDS